MASKRWLGSKNNNWNWSMDELKELVYMNPTATAIMVSIHRTHSWHIHHFHDTGLLHVWLRRWHLWWWGVLQLPRHKLRSEHQPRRGRGGIRQWERTGERHRDGVTFLIGICSGLLADQELMGPSLGRGRLHQDDERLRPLRGGHLQGHHARMWCHRLNIVSQ